MAIKEERIAAPERPGGQGLDANQEESGNRPIAALLTDPVRGSQTDLVITYRDGPDGQGAYEVWAARGMIRFQRFYDEGGACAYRVIERMREDPIGNQDPTALATLAQELEAGAKSGYSGTDPAQAFVEPEQLSYPLAMERIAQLFDSPNAPDIVISPRSYAFGRQPGQHGALDVVQSRAPLVLSGPGVKPGVTDAVCAQGDGARKGQAGRPRGEILDLDGRGEPRRRPERVYIMLLDGLSNTELQERLEKDAESIPNLRGLGGGGVGL